MTPRAQDTHHGRRDQEEQGWAWTIFRAQLAFGLLLLAISISLIVFITWTYSRDMALDQAREKAEIILSHTAGTHKYFSTQLKPHLFSKLSDEDPDYFAPVWMSSTYAVRSINSALRDAGYGYSYKACAVNARSPQYEADPFEREVLARFNMNPDLTVTSAVREIDGEDYLNVFYRGDTMTGQCMRCHTTAKEAPVGLVEQYGPTRGFNRQLGEVSAAFSIRVPLSHALRQARMLTVQVSLAICGVFLLSMALIYFFNRRSVIAPLKSITNGLERICEGAAEDNKPLAQPPLEEFRRLVNSFNALSENMRQQLLCTKSDLGGTIDEVNTDLERFRSLFMFYPDPCAMVETSDGGADFVVLEANAAALESLGDIKGRSVTGLCSDDSKKELLHSIQRVWRTKAPKRLVVECADVHGEVRPRNWLLVPVTGGRVGLVVDAAS